jgi:DNA invertase Pin-like site-specific DNA recombinase
VNDVRIGYARCSTDKQDLTAQRDYLLGARVPEASVHLDYGLSGKDRARPALNTALAQISGARQAAPADTTVTLVVPKLDRLGRSIRDLHDIADEVTDCGGRLEFAGKVYDPTDAMDKMFFNILATFAEFERDLLVQRTKEGMAVGHSRTPPPAEAAGASSLDLVVHRRHGRWFAERVRRQPERGRVGGRRAWVTLQFDDLLSAL